MKERNPALDYAKAIGIMLVVLGHVLEYAGETGAVYKLIYAFHMPLFFVISGIAMSYKTHTDRRTEIEKALKGLLLPYIVWSLIYLAALSLIGGVQMKERIYAFLSLRGLPPLWFLADLFLAKLLLIATGDRLRNRRFRIAALLASVVLTLLLYPIISQFDDRGLLLRYPAHAVCRVFPTITFLLVGYLVGIHEDLLDKNKTPILAAAICIFALLQSLSGETVNMHQCSLGNPLIFLLTGTSGAAAVIYLCKLLPKTLVWLSEIGRRSLDIMLLHYWRPIPLIPFVFEYVTRSCALAFIAVFLSATVLGFLLSAIRIKVKGLRT